MPDLERVYRQLDQIFKNMLGLPYPHDLGRVYRLMDRLGRPHAAFPAIIVTGSKGKGSTATFLAALLQQPSRKIGLFTGPHLHSYRERFKINASDIDPATFVELFDEVWQVVQQSPDQEQISRFEIITAMAMLYFARNQVDLAVLEVGLGGRFDAVNVAQNVALSVFTPLELEHLHALGPTLEAIVYHKSGVMRPGGRAVSSHQSSHARELLENAARDIGANLHPAAELWQYQPQTLKLSVENGSLTQQFEATGPDNRLYHLQSRLAGTFQLENALTALAAASLVEDRSLPNLAGLFTALIPGRFEVVATDPMVIIDGAHTPNAMRELAATLQNLPGTPVWVLGFLRDKQINLMLQQLPLEGKTVFLQHLHSYRAATIDQIRDNLNQTPARLEANDHDLSATIEAAREVARSLPGGYVCVTGSLYTAAETRVALGLLDPTTAREAAWLTELDRGYPR